MDKPHKQVITSYPVAIKYGQSRVHIPNPIPWHALSETVQCPQCATIYILTSGFPRMQFFDVVKKQHARSADKSADHPDVIASDETWTRIEDCDCNK